jgi:hypothetical protein
MVKGWLPVPNLAMKALLFLISSIRQWRIVERGGNRSWQRIPRKERWFEVARSEKSPHRRGSPRLILLLYAYAKNELAGLTPKAKLVKEEFGNESENVQ